MARQPRPWYRFPDRGWHVTVNKKRHNLGVKDPGDKAAAWAAFQHLLKTLNVEPPAGSSHNPTVSGAVASFLKSAEGRLSEATVKGYRSYLARFAARFGTEPLSAVTRERIEESSRRPTWGDDTRRNYLQAVEVLMRHCGRPMQFEKPPRGSAGAAAVIPEQTYHMAVGSARGDLRALLVCLWNTGCRPSELRALTVELVDWSSGTATLTRHKTRRSGKAHRLVVFPPPALEVLQRQRERHKTGLLFRTNRGTAFTCPGLTQAVWRIARRIGRPITSYGCRHTFATDALAQGIPDTHVAALLGHGSTRMIHQHYSHLSENARLLKEQAAKVRGAG